MKRFKKRGDTIIEVTIAISIFSLVSIISLQLMDRDIALLQGALEAEMARNEIDAQAEALRYIQNAYLSERELASNKREYQKLWLKLSRGDVNNNASKVGVGLANEAADISQYSSVACRQYYENDNSGEAYHSLFKDKGFVINTRKVNPKNVNETIIQTSGDGAVANPKRVFVEAPLYPRIVFTNIGGTNPAGVQTDHEALSEYYPEGVNDPTFTMQQSHKLFDQVKLVEGIWVIAVKQDTGVTNKEPEFYDFHIRTCWYAPGKSQSSTIATTIRLYNPEYIEAQR